MSDAKGQQEPSMEEILASIRRIISEDGDDVEAMPPRPQVAPEPISEPTLQPLDMELEPVAVGTVAMDPRPAMASHATIEPEPDFPVEPALVAAAAGDVLDLTEMVGEDGAISLAGVSEPAAAPEPDRSDGFDEPVSTPIRQPTAAGEASLEAFAQLKRAVQAKKDRPVPPPPRPAPAGGSMTVDQVVAEAVKPMLREWLDRNLEPMVERLVDREIRRITSQQED